MTAQTAQDTIPSDSLNTDLLDSLIFDTVNRERLKIKEAKLFWSDELMAACRAQSERMLEEGKVSYSDAKAGECILTMTFPSGEETYGSLAQSIVQRWLDSPGHKKLILGSFFIEGGAGTAYSYKKGEGFTLMASFQVSYF